MVLGVIPLILATGAGAESRFDIGLVIATGISIGTALLYLVVPAMYMLLAEDYSQKKPEESCQNKVSYAIFEYCFVLIILSLTVLVHDQHENE